MVRAVAMARSAVRELAAALAVGQEWHAPVAKRQGELELPGIKLGECGPTEVEWRRCSPGCAVIPECQLPPNQAGL